MFLESQATILSKLRESLQWYKEKNLQVDEVRTFQPIVMLFLRGISSALAETFTVQAANGVDLSAIIETEVDQKTVVGSTDIVVHYKPVLSVGATIDTVVYESTLIEVKPYETQLSTQNGLCRGRDQMLAQLIAVGLLRTNKALISKQIVKGILTDLSVVTLFFRVPSPRVRNKLAYLVSSQIKDPKDYILAILYAVTPLRSADTEALLNLIDLNDSGSDEDDKDDHNCVGSKNSMKRRNIELESKEKRSGGRRSGSGGRDGSGSGSGSGSGRGRGGSISGLGGSRHGCETSRSCPYGDRLIHRGKFASLRTRGIHKISSDSIPRSNVILINDNYHNELHEESLRLLLISESRRLGIPYLSKENLASLASKETFI